MYFLGVPKGLDILKAQSMFSLRCHNLYYQNLWCRRRMHFRISSRGSPRRDAFVIPNSASLPIIRLHLLNLFKFRPYFIPERTILRRIRRTTLAVKSYRLRRPLSYGPSTPKIHVIFESIRAFSILETIAGNDKKNDVK